MAVTELHLAIVPIDEAWRRTEQKWGVGRLERLVSAEARAALHRGMNAYDDAIGDRNAMKVAEVGAKLIRLLGQLDAEAERLGHKPIDPSCWEAALADGSVLVVCRTTAEAGAVSRAALKGEGNLPADLQLAVAATQAGRALHVWTMYEVARMIEAVGSPVSAIKQAFPEARIVGGIPWNGEAVRSGVLQDEMLAHDTVRHGEPWVDAATGTDGLP